MNAELRAELAEKNAQYETRNWVLEFLTDAELGELAAGRVPDRVREMADGMLHWRLDTREVPRPTREKG